MSEFTKGPWMTRDEEDCFIRQASNDRLWIASTINIPNKLGGDLATKANARLIAAAPELLEACKKALNRNCGCHDSTGADWHSDSCAVPAIKGAIAKAEGK